MTLQDTFGAGFLLACLIALIERAVGKPIGEWFRWGWALTLDDDPAPRTSAVLPILDSPLTKADDTGIVSEGLGESSPVFTPWPGIEQIDEICAANPQLSDKQAQAVAVARARAGKP